MKPNFCPSTWQCHLMATFRFAFHSQIRVFHVLCQSSWWCLSIFWSFQGASTNHIPSSAAAASMSHNILFICTIDFLMDKTCEAHSWRLKPHVSQGGCEALSPSKNSKYSDMSIKMWIFRQYWLFFLFFYVIETCWIRFWGLLNNILNKNSEFSENG